MSDAHAQRQLATQLRGMLEPGETVLWSGAPDLKAYRTLNSGGGWVALIFVLVGFGAPGYWFSVTETKDAGFWFYLLFFSLPGFMGLWAFTLPYRAQQQAGRTLYAITGHRALIVTTSQAPESIGLDQLDSIGVTERRGGSGDLTLRFDHDRARDQPVPVRRDRFVGLPRVREVAAILRRAASGESAPVPAASGAPRVPAGVLVDERRLLPWLDADEHISWAGKPSPRAKRTELRNNLAFSTAWTVTVLVFGAGFYLLEKKLGFVQAVLMIFLIIGLHRFRMAAHSASAHQRVVYAVTDRRAIVAEFGSDVTIRTFFPKRLPDVLRVRGKDGLESVVLRTDLTLQGDDVREEPAGFLDLEDADDAVNAYRRLCDGGRPEARA